MRLLSLDSIPSEIGSLLYLQLIAYAIPSLFAALVNLHIPKLFCLQHLFLLNPVVHLFSKHIHILMSQFELLELVHLFRLHSPVDFFPVHRDLFWRTYSESHLMTFHFQHRHRDLVSDHYSLANLSRQYQHHSLLESRTDFIVQ